MAEPILELYKVRIEVTKFEEKSPTVHEGYISSCNDCVFSVGRTNSGVVNVAAQYVPREDIPYITTLEITKLSKSIKIESLTLERLVEGAKNKR